MITVVGGTYRERCREPSWDELYGSGLRAACVLRGLGAKVQLQTLISADRKALLQSIAGQHSIDLVTTTIPRTIGFFYQHGMATPEVIPDPRRLDHGIQLQNLAVKASRVLCFGFIEGAVAIDGDQVVYDPQSPTCPNPFRARGCSAERLVIIANRSELTQLSGTERIDRACQQVLKAEKAEAVIAKLGPNGCLVVTAKQRATVPAFRTQQVFPIGSGDAFSAAFAFAWIEQERSPVEAALFASRAAAYYCEHRTFPRRNLSGWKPPPLRVLPQRQHHGVYLAGPFFNAGQRWVIDELHQALLQARLKVFSPMHDVGPGPAEMIWKPDIDGLRNAGVVLAVIDGLDPGTIYEIGYAQSRQMPIIALVSAEREEDLKMLRGGGCDIVDDIPTAVYHTSWAAMCR